MLPFIDSAMRGFRQCRGFQILIPAVFSYALPDHGSRDIAVFFQVRSSKSALLSDNRVRFFEKIRRFLQIGNIVQMISNDQLAGMTIEKDRSKKSTFWGLPGKLEATKPK